MKLTKSSPKSTPTRSNSRRARLLAATALAVFFLQGSSCLRVERPYPPPSPEGLLSALRAARLELRTLRGEARMTHVSPQEKVKATVRMMATVAGRLRFDLVSPFDTPMATLVCRDGRFALVDVRENRHYHGPASPCNLARLLRLRLPPEEVLGLLTGGTPIIEHTQRTVQWDDRDGVEVLRLTGAALTQSIRLRRAGKRWQLLSSEIRNAAAKVLLRVVASQPKVRAGIPLPQRIRIAQPKHDISLHLEFRSQEVNIEMPTQAFELPAAKGLRSEYVECPASSLDAN